MNVVKADADRRVPGTILPPDETSDRWRYVNEAGQLRVYGRDQVLLVEYLSTHVGTLKQACDETGVGVTQASRMLALPHVKSLLMQQTQAQGVMLGGLALQVLVEGLTSEELSPAQRVKLALQVLESPSLNGLVSERTLENHGLRTKIAPGGGGITLVLNHGDHNSVPNGTTLDGTSVEMT